MLDDEAELRLEVEVEPVLVLPCSRQSLFDVSERVLLVRDGDDGGVEVRELGAEFLERGGAIGAVLGVVWRRQLPARSLFLQHAHDVLHFLVGVAVVVNALAGQLARLLARRLLGSELERAREPCKLVLASRHVSFHLAELVGESDERLVVPCDVRGDEHGIPRRALQG